MKTQESTRPPAYPQPDTNPDHPYRNRADSHRSRTVGRLVAAFLIVAGAVVIVFGIDGSGQHLTFAGVGVEPWQRAGAGSMLVVGGALLLWPRFRGWFVRG